MTDSLTEKGVNVYQSPQSLGLPLAHASGLVTVQVHNRHVLILKQKAPLFCFPAFRLAYVVSAARVSQHLVSATPDLSDVMLALTKRALSLTGN